MRVPIAPEGRRELLLAGIVAVALAVIGVWWFWPLVVVSVVGWLAVALFFRDPQRRPPGDPSAVVAPADGWVRQIIRDSDHPLVGGPALRLQIFLSLFDVHINRSPCAGQVREVRYQPGRFLNAMRDEAGEANEANAVVLHTDYLPHQPVVVRQIAGVLARRIVCHVGPGDQLQTGERIGMIKFGSRTELLVPDVPNWRVAVRVGQHVRAGQTILMHWQQESNVAEDGEQA
jgi:phosphatidylserine decarboxylase